MIQLINQETMYDITLDGVTYSLSVMYCGVTDVTEFALYDIDGEIIGDKGIINQAVAEYNSL